MKTYSGSVKRYQFFTRFVLIVIALVLSFFLIQISHLVLRDVRSWTPEPRQEAYAEDAKTLEVNKGLESLNQKNQVLEDEADRIRKSWDVAERRYQSEKETYHNWLQARQTIGSPNEDLEIRNKLQRLDQHKRISEQWQTKLGEVGEKQATLQKEITVQQEKRYALEAAQDKKYQAAYQRYELSVFTIRLLIALPILAIGIFFFIRYRKSKYWPLVWGFILFSVYVFFIGVVPYIPHFGIFGYVRYTAGVLLTIIVGYYLILQLAHYSERKRKELEQSQEERAKSIRQESAFKAYESHCCPSCEKDILYKKWSAHQSSAEKGIKEEDAPDYCVYCGLRLFAPCEKCKTRVFAHFPFCPACGAVTTKK